MSDNTLELAGKMLQIEEGFRPTPYYCPTGHLTIGFGQRIDSLRLTRELALILLEEETKKLDKWLTRTYYNWYPTLSSARKAILISIAYQVGTTGFVKFRQMIAALGRGDYETAANEILDSLAARQTPERWKRNAEFMRNNDIHYNGAARITE